MIWTEESHVDSRTPTKPPSQHRLDILQNTLLELPLNFLTLVVRPRLAVQSHQGTKIKLGCLQQLNLANMNLKVMSENTRVQSN